MNKTIELVIFKLINGSASNDFVAANEKLSEWLRNQPGFEFRNLSLQDDGSWVDVLQWSSMENAKRAAEKIMQELGNSPCMAMIDPDSVKMSHSQVMLSL